MVLIRQDKKTIFDFSIISNSLDLLEYKKIYLHCYNKNTKTITKHNVEYFIQNKHIYFSVNNILIFGIDGKLSKDQVDRVSEGLCFLLQENKIYHFHNDFVYFDDENVYFLSDDFIYFLMANHNQYLLVKDDDMQNIITNFVYEKLTNIKYNPKNHLSLSYFFQISPELEIENISKTSPLQYIQKLKNTNLTDNVEKNKQIYHKYLSKRIINSVLKFIFSKKLIIISVSLTIVFFICLFLTILSPAKQKNMQKYQIANKYYQSINNLDLDFLDDILKTKDDFLSIVAYIKISLTYKNSGKYINCDEFFAKNMTIGDLKKNSILHGIRNLKITLHENYFESEFDYYLSHQTKDKRSIQIDKTHYVQYLLIEKIDKNYYITKIKNASKIQIIYAKLDLLTQNNI